LHLRVKLHPATAFFGNPPTIHDVSKLTDQWIELFRAGKYPQGDISTEDLDQVVANYKPANAEYEEAPATIGHPEDDAKAPAWGWWGDLKRAGNVLLGKMKQVQPEFEEMVQKGLFKKRSVGLVKRNSGWNLHHVAFLGAQAPQVKGLADIKFASDGSLMKVEFEESAMAAETVATEATFWEKLTAKIGELIDGKKAGTASATFSEADVKRIAGEAAATAAAEAVKPVQAKLEKAEAKFAEREASLATGETRARADAAIAKVKASGKWVPAFAKAGLEAVFTELAKTTTQIEFGEGDAKKKQTPLEILVNFMEQLPKIVPSGTIYQGQPSMSAAKPAGVNPGGVPVDQGSIRFHEAIVAYRKDHDKVTYAEAAMLLQAEHPELLQPVAAAGAV